MMGPIPANCLPILDHRGQLIGWRGPPRIIVVGWSAVACVAFTPGMLLRVDGIDAKSVSFQVLHEGDR